MYIELHPVSHGFTTYTCNPDTDIIAVFISIMPPPFPMFSPRPISEDEFS
jgi:hypothetical protein